MSAIRPFLSRLTGKVAVVTGGANGIGLAIATRFAREGAKVTISDIDVKGGLLAVKLIESLGGVAQFVHCTAGNEEETAALMQASRAKYGPANILVNNAAAFYFGTLKQVQRQDWLRLYEVNVIGYADCIKYILPDFEHNGKGAVVNIASVSSFIAQPDMVVYNAVKGGVAQITRCLAMDLASSNVRVNAICPGAVWTPASGRHMKFLGITEAEGKVQFGNGNVLKVFSSHPGIHLSLINCAAENRRC